MNSKVTEYFNELRTEMKSWRHDLHRHPEDERPSVASREVLQFIHDKPS